MYHSTSFCAAGSAIRFLTSVASWVLALRASSMASLTSARSPVSGGTASFGARACLGAGSVFDGFALRCAEACLAGRLFAAASRRWERASLIGCGFLVAACAFWACGFWLARALASVERKASPAIATKQDSEHKHRFIPWSPCETHVTNTVKTKRSRDACGLSRSKATTTPTMQSSRLYNKRVQNEADGNQESSRYA